jgi:hypothetical protein
VIKAYQLLAHGRWFSPGTPASSTTKIDHHDIAEILLKVALSTKNQSINQNRFVSIKKLCFCCGRVIPLSIIYQLFEGNLFYWLRKPECPEKTDKLDHIMLY